MPRQSYFDRYPPFPKNEPIADLPRLSCAKLVAEDSEEVKLLFEISKACGFFLLDFSDIPDYDSLIKDVESAFELNRAWHDLGLEQKKQYVLSAGNVGYKPMGFFPDSAEGRDLTELTSLSRSHILGVTESTIPPFFNECDTTLKRLVERLHSVALMLLSRLDSYLDLPSGLLESFHTLSEPSDSVLRFVHNPPQDVPDKHTSLGGHTDNGSITILFNVIGGLQILPPGAKDDNGNWRLVQPVPGCAIINIGDSLTQWTGGVLRSNLHRVAYAPGQQSTCERYSFGYFLKPTATTSMRRLEVGDVIPKDVTGEDQQFNDLAYHDWHKRKTKALLQGRSDPHKATA